MASIVRGMTVGLVLSAAFVCAAGGPVLASPCADHPTGKKGETLHVGFTASPPFVVPAASDRKKTIDRCRFPKSLRLKSSRLKSCV